MASSRSPSPSSSSYSRPSLARSSLCDPIQEEEKEEKVKERKKRTPRKTTPLTHQSKKVQKPGDSASDSVSCSTCRPSSRVKPSPSPSPQVSFLRSFFLRTPNSTTAASSTTTSSLKLKLLAATRARDEALLESTRLKLSLTDLHLKLSRLQSQYPTPTSSSSSSFPVEPFLRSVSESRSSTRLLARSLSAHLAPHHLIHNTESFLNQVFFAGFELDDDAETLLADPAKRCESNRAAYELLRGLTWEEVLRNGTKHYSPGLSRFCDVKMSDVAGSLGSARPWTERLLQAFFYAAKAAWVVRLMARSAHPPIPIIRVDGGARFDPKFMEDVGVDRTSSGPAEPVAVKMMVAPGFHVYTIGAGVVKCRVLCWYSHRTSDVSDNSLETNVRRNRVGGNRTEIV
ncbi:IRK-interacting protein-like [Typha angustifolia]|uniref:IRK-interacting protein-like n=1 Tax=Typha angustifolia TaxID=59011 RepID=UPI003C2C10D7